MILNRVKDFWRNMVRDQRGITTSEFWLTMGTVMTTLGSVVFAGMPPMCGGVFLTLVCVGYTLSRGLAKRTTVNDIDINHYDDNQRHPSQPEGRECKPIKRQRRNR